MPLSGKHIALGVTGSIAAYKAVLVLRGLQQAGATVQVVQTAAAEKFVGSLTFQSLSRRPVFSDLWAEGDTWTQHVHLGKQADLYLIAPCSANTLAKLAHGGCDNAVTAVYLAAECPVVVAPAMDREMFAHSATQRNLAQLQADGVHIISPGSGYLASGLEGAGRLAEADTIVQFVREFFARNASGPLAGKRVLITAGPTQEALDPVRYLSNHSSGKMGIALAHAAWARGAEVTLVLGPSREPVPPHIKVLRVTSAEEMFGHVAPRQSEQDVIIMAAAVSDYRPATPSATKLKKTGRDLALELAPTPDILAHLGQHKPTGQCLVGFALETDNELEYARMKLAKKNLDLIVLNSLNDAGAGFEHPTNRVTLLDASGEPQAFDLKPKTAVAQDILDRVEGLLRVG